MSFEDTVVFERFVTFTALERPFLCVDSTMSFEDVVVCEGFFTFTALERPFLCVPTHVALQMPRGDTTVVALVTFEWLFSSVIPHHVLFEICLAAEVAQSAFISHFPVVDPFVLLQVDGFN